MKPFRYSGEKLIQVIFSGLLNIFGACFHRSQAVKKLFRVTLIAKRQKVGSPKCTVNRLLAICFYEVGSPFVEKFEAASERLPPVGIRILSVMLF